MTTTALALAAVSSGVMVEVDPSGGSVDCWLGATGEPGLIPVASALRRQAEATALVGLASEVVPGVRAIRAPTSGALAESTLVAIGGRLAVALGGLEELVLLDAGRWSRSQPTANRVGGCDVVAVVCSPTIEGVESARWLITQVTTVGDRVCLVLVGDRPYGIGEVAEVVGVPVAGALAWDQRGLARLLDGGVSTGWARTALGRSARSLLDRLVGLAAPPSAPASEAAPVPPVQGVAHA